MTNLLIRIVIGILLIIHGFAHWQITTGWGSQPEAGSWLLTGAAASTMGALLWMTALLLFIGAGAAILFHQGWWRPLAVIAAVVSLAVMLLFWQPVMILGVVVDLAILVALLWAHWPAVEIAGA